MRISLLPHLVCGFVSLAGALHAGVQPVALSANDTKPLAVGTKAPSFELTASDGTRVNLANEFSAKPTILVFYRGSWCPYCNRQLAALGEIEPQLLTLGYQIIAISPDDAEGLKKTIGKNHLNYRLLSDRGMQASSAYGLAFQVPAETEKNYHARGFDLAPLPDRPGSWLPVPTVFIIGRDSVIRFVFSNPDYKVRLGNAELLAAAKNTMGE